MNKYSDKLLESLRQVYIKNPDDLNFKKYFALELYKKGKLEDALPLLTEVFKLDKDINVDKALDVIKSKLKSSTEKLGFDVEEKQQEEIKKKHLAERDTITFADVAGINDVKEAIRTDIIYPFQHPKIYKKYNKKAGGGILLYGPPGCGKTYIAKATAGEINAEFITVHIHELISSFAGEGERILHDTFDQARENAPSVLFFDEIDAIGMSRSKTSGVLRTLVNQFLTELDGISSENENVLVIGATNLPWEVDPALRRPGRFGKVIFVSPPDKEARIRIFKLNFQKLPHSKIDYDKLAGLTRQYSSADIKHICEEASETTFKKAIKSGRVEKVTQELIEETISKVKSSILDWFSTIKNYIKYSDEARVYDDVKDYLKKLKNDK